MEHTNDKILTYAIDRDGKLVHIGSVQNGLDCGCICPFCHMELIAKNNGQHRAKHFAHKGDVCTAYYETALHMLAKEIVKEEKTVMLPAYKNLESTKICFKEVEVEERKDSSKLQPDCVGIAEDGLRIHVEFFVTHKVDERKKEIIEKNVINCVEIRIPNDFPLDYEKLKDFIENKNEGRVWINYPYGEEINTKIEREQQERAAQEKKEKALWYVKNKRNMLKSPIECIRCEFKTPQDNCIYQIEDFEYEGKAYIVCDFKPVVNEKPYKDAKVYSPSPVVRKNITMEQYRKDFDNGVCPLCGARIRRRTGSHGEYWHCVNPSCKWSWK